MLLTMIDNEMVAKTCSRTFMKFNLDIRSQGYTMDSFAEALDNKNSVEKKAYQKLVKEFKKKTGLQIRLTLEYSCRRGRVSSSQTYNFATARYTNPQDEEISWQSMNKPLWITPLKLAPELRRAKARVIQLNR